MRLPCRRWIQSVLENDPDYFSRYKDVQTPQYFWIGCSDSRVVAEAALGLGVGDLFVHRNVGNCISHYDQNAMSALEYSVKVCSQAHASIHLSTPDMPDTSLIKLLRTSVACNMCPHTASMSFFVPYSFSTQLSQLSQLITRTLVSP